MIKQHFLQWLHVYLNEQLIYSDGLASRLVYEALENDECAKSVENRPDVDGSKFAA